jgi:hypothetical protein
MDLARRRADRTLRAARYVPLILGLVALFVFLAIIVNSTTHGCAAAARPHATATARVISCQSLPEPHGRP